MSAHRQGAHIIPIDSNPLASSSQKDFSGVLQNSVQWISLVETGRQDLTVHTIVRIAAKLGVEPANANEALIAYPEARGFLFEKESEFLRHTARKRNLSEKQWRGRKRSAAASL